MSVRARQEPRCNVQEAVVLLGLSDGDSDPLVPIRTYGQGCIAARVEELLVSFTEPQPHEVRLTRLDGQAEVKQPLQDPGPLCHDQFDSSKQFRASAQALDGGCLGDRGHRERNGAPAKTTDEVRVADHVAHAQPGQAVRLSTMAEMAVHPRWWFNVLTTEPMTFSNLTSTGGALGDMVSRALDPGITGQDISWIRDNWSGPLMVKGIQCLEDALMVADLGVDAIVLSNHGGRQLDMGRAPLELLPEVADAVDGRVEVYIDGGITSGTDIVAALALGARGALVGRAYLYGLMAGGYDGVVRVAQILEKEIRTTMQLLGVTAVSELDEGAARLRSATS